MLAILLAGAPPAARAEPSLAEAIDAAAARVEERVVAWRRDLHRHPELSNRERRTAARVAVHLKSLGLEVRTGVAHTGVVGVLRGRSRARTVALRADMDALPVTEETGLPFASRERTTYLGREVGVMHACGHDAHTAILMGVAEVLARVRERLDGDVLFVFQPAEEGAPPGERGGAALMLEEGAFDDPRPDAVFGLHVVPQHEVGTVAYRVRGAMASSDKLRIAVRGRQTHAAYPWLGIDPIATAARVILALESLPARAVDARIPSVVSIGAVHGGVRHNIIPDEVELLGTIRSLDAAQREALHAAVRRSAAGIAASTGSDIDVEIDPGYPVTYNDPALAARAVAILERVVSPERGERLEAVLPRTGAEDFAFFAERVPGFYFWLGVRSRGVLLGDVAPNHSPRFVVDEEALPLGIRALAHLAAETLAAPGAR